MQHAVLLLALASLKSCCCPAQLWSPPPPPPPPDVAAHIVSPLHFISPNPALSVYLTSSTGTSRTVEFEFDEAVETVAALAGEMVSDLELTPDDASVIATALEQELNRLSAEPQVRACVCVCVCVLRAVWWCAAACALLVCVADVCGGTVYVAGCRLDA